VTLTQPNENISFGHATKMEHQALSDCFPRIKSARLLSIKLSIAYQSARDDLNLRGGLWFHDDQANTQIQHNNRHYVISSGDN
jgi:hypothetical protein